MTDRISTATMADEVTDRMRALLVSGHFAAGEKLRMRDLELRFGISHIPIREALRRLEAEGLIETSPQRTAVAAPVSPALLEEVYDARRLIEPSLARRAAAEMLGESREALIEAYRTLEETTLPSDDFYRAHARFHWLLLAPAATGTLERFIRQLWAMSERYLRLLTAGASPLSGAVDDHRRLYRLAVDQDPKVGDVLAEHLALVVHAVKHGIATDVSGTPSS